MLEPGSLFEVADRELDHGMAAMELVDLDSGAFEVGEETEVTPIGPQFQLCFVGQACATRDQPAGHFLVAGAGRVRAFGDFRFTAVGVLDRRPRSVRDLGDGIVDAFVGTFHGHRVTHVQPVQREDRVAGPEPGIEPDRQPARCAGASGAGDELVDESSGPALSVR